ncbi:cbb3-type cytochrome c oxidase subunit 3 [Labilibaculum sp. K2S]|uniref:cbb3-type cytochrome oxidase subunit 3 n=1 Tax=Labilibaculum sp. K2S TaxID=3056386 RepID=UPI0025A33D0F|nr:cbb3-type cytochrome c oxidase subunit 3 [Labilibaculum sp. K2S]MDM8158979.1 cbb3-type cytochrome c oxidase subunit 3 [Labilibaculum sp. K2S]
MKIVSHYLQGIADVGFFPSISLLIFFLFFAGMLWWTFKKSNKEFFTEMESYALDEDGVNSSSEAKE